MLLHGLVRRLIVTFEALRVVRQEACAPCQVAAYLLPVRGPPHIDVAHDLADRAREDVAVRRRVVRQPHAERVEVPLGRVEVTILLGDRSVRVVEPDRLPDRRSSAYGCARRERPLQPAAERARHRAAVGLVLCVKVTWPDGVLCVLVRSALPRVVNVVRLAHEDAILLIVAQPLVGGAAHIDVPRAEQRRVPLVKARLVGQHILRHTERVHGAPQGSLVAVILVDQRECRLVNLCLALDPRRRRFARVAPLRKGLGESECGFSDAVLELLGERGVGGDAAGQQARKEQQRGAHCVASLRARCDGLACFSVPWSASRAGSR
eukprot:2302080-Prymnesium_polylepis.3